MEAEPVYNLFNQKNAEVLVKTEDYIDSAWDAVLTADVRFDKRLSAEEKLLYAEIRSMCRKKGNCWPSNAFLAELFSTSERSIQRWLSSLEDCKYINFVFQERKNSSPLRVIFINQSSFFEGGGTTLVSPYPDTSVTLPRHPCHPTLLYIEEDNIKKYNVFLAFVNETLKKKYKPNVKKWQSSYLSRIKDGYTHEQIIQATKNIYADEFHKKTNYKHATPEFITRADKLEKFLNVTIEEEKPKPKFNFPI